MKTIELISRLNYLLGRFEGIASVIPESQQTALLDTCEWLQELIDELDPKETVSADDLAKDKIAYTASGDVTIGRNDACVTCSFYDLESDYCTLFKNSVGSCHKKNITLPNTATVTNDPHRVTTAYNHDNDWELLKKEIGVENFCEVKP